MLNRRELVTLGFCLHFCSSAERSSFRDCTLHSQQPLSDSGCLRSRSRAEARLRCRGQAV